MGRWDYSNRDVVEECRVVDISFLKKHSFLKSSRYGLLKWTNSSGKENSIGVQSLVNEGPISVTFTYTITKPSGEKEDLNYKTELTKTPCNYGGFRYWFKCGGIVNGVCCGRRVAKLYKAPSGKYFLCRHCYNLTYDLRKKNKSWSYKIDRIDKKIMKINEKLDRGGLHSKTYDKLLKKRDYLNFCLQGTFLLDMRNSLSRNEKISKNFLDKDSEDIL